MAKNKNKTIKGRGKSSSKLLKQKLQGSIKPAAIPHMQMGMRPGQVPPFHELLEYTFQDLCRDLLHRESGAKSCSHFGVRGQAQFGADLVAELPNDINRDVGQCKAYEKFIPSEIKLACDVFLEHKKFWKKKKTKRFILMVGCPLETVQHHEEASRQKDRFKRHGFKFELWDASTIRLKLQPYRDVVNRYCHPPALWVEQICGPSSIALPAASNQETVIVNTVLTSQIAQLTQSLSEIRSKELEAHRAKLREGKRTSALEWVQAVRKNHIEWGALSPEDRSRAIRLEASILLDSDTALDQVNELADLAHKECPKENDSRLRALIAHRQGNNERALEILKGHEDLESLNLRSALELSRGNFQACVDALDSIGSENENGESYRIRALAALSQKDLSTATLAIEKAVEAAPNWQAVKFSCGMIYYHWSLATAALNGKINAWPDPISWPLVRKDRLSTEKLEASINIFRELIRDADDPTEKLRYELWHLAALFNSPARQSEAADLCKALFKKNPEDPYLAAWIGTRNISVDIDAAISTLEGKSKSAQAVLVLVGYYHVQKKFEKALVALDENQALFSDSDLQVSWLYWKAQTLVASNRSQDALDVLATSTNQNLDRVKLLALESLDDQKSTSAAVQFAKNVYEKTKDPEFLYSWANLLKRDADWKQLSMLCDDLLRLFQTVNAVYVCAEACFKAREYERGLKVLSNCASFFPESKLPNDLRRLKSGMLRGVGQISEAVAEAEELVNLEGSTENLVNLSAIYLDMADLRRLNLIARRLSEKIDLPNSTRLKLANVLVSEDPSTSRLLWKTLDPTRLNDNEVGAALSLAHQLGEERHRGFLVHRMQVLASEGKGGISVHSVEEVLKFIKEGAERFSKIHNLYREGSIPIHFAVSGMHTDLATIYHSSVDRNLKISASESPSSLFFFHGGRGDASAVIAKKSSIRLVMDTTSLLFAKQFGFLEEIIDAVKTIHIAPSTPKLLISTRDKHLHPQPERIKAQKIILGLRELEKFQVVEEAKINDEDGERKFGRAFLNTLTKAKKYNCLAVDFFPPSKGLGEKIDDSDLTPELPILATARSVLNSLLSSGKISRSDFDQFLERLGTLGVEVSSLSPLKVGSRIYLAGTIPEVMAGAGLFELVCQNFEVFLEEDALVRARSEIHSIDVVEERINWVTEVIQFVSDGISSGKVKLLQVSADVEDDEEHAENLESASLKELLQFVQSEDDVNVADDRLFNSYSSSGKVPIVTSVDLIKALEKRNLMLPARLFSLLHSMRAAKILFIPIDAEEVCFHLSQAVTSSGFSETNELAVIRRYVAFCLTQSDSLQKPPRPEGAPNPHGELAIAMSMKRLAENTLINIWNDTAKTVPAKIAMSGWVLENLYVGSAGIRAALGIGVASSDNRYLSALDLSSFLTQAVMISNAKVAESEEGSRSIYLKWISGEFIVPKLASDPLLVDQIANCLKGLLAFDKSKVNSVELERGKFYIALQVINHLPEPIRDKVHEDSAFMQGLGLSVQSHVGLSDLSFLSDDFWGMVVEAVKTGTATAKPTNAEQPIEFKRFSEDNVFGLKYQNPKSLRVEAVFFDEVDLLTEDASLLKRALEKRRDLVDGEEKNFKTIELDLLAAKSPSLKMEIISRLKAQSGTYFYKTLREKIRQQRGVVFSQLIPEQLLTLKKHYRIESDSSRSAVEIAENAVSLILKEPDVADALLRMCGMPLPIPEAIFNRLDEVGSVERRKIFGTLLITEAGPIAKAHLVSLLLRYREDSPRYFKLATKISLKISSSAGIKQGEVFNAILSWCHGELSTLHATENGESHTLLLIAWAHASRIYSILKSLGLDDEWLIESFTERTGLLSGDFLTRREEIYWDVMNPRLLSEEFLAFFCISHIRLGSDLLKGSDRLKEQISELVFKKTEEGILLPKLPFLRGSASLKNMFCSFLGVDNEVFVSEAFGENALKMLDPFRKDVISAALSNFDKGSVEGSDPWDTIFTFLGDFYPPVESQELVKEILAKFDAIALVRKEPVRGTYLFKLACAQASHLKLNDLCLRLDSQLENIFIHLKESATNFDERQGAVIISSLLEATVHLASIDGSISVATRLSKLADALTVVFPRNRRVLSKLFLQLSLESAPDGEQYLWPALLKIRRS